MMCALAPQTLAENVAQLPLNLLSFTLVGPFQNHLRIAAGGNRSGDRYDIPSGLRPGERIVADGAIFVQFMQNQ